MSLLRQAILAALSQGATDSRTLRARIWAMPRESFHDYVSANFFGWLSDLVVERHISVEPRDGDNVYALTESGKRQIPA